MKAEHKQAVERARLHGVHPMVFAHQLMVHDLTDAALFELRNIKAPFGRLNEDEQQEVIDRITKKAHEVVQTAIGIISTRSVESIPVTVNDAKFKPKVITITGAVDAQDPNRHELIDVAGKLCLLVVAPSDYAEGVDGIRAERDQHELPLSASELVAGMGLDRERDSSSDDDELAGFDDTLTDGEDPLYSEAVAFITDTRRASIGAIQRKLKIGYNRAARILEAMELAGLVTAPNSNGAREVIAPADTQAAPERQEQADLKQAPEQALAGQEALHSQHAASTGKEFGDLSYSEAQQIVVLHGNSVTNAWLQRRIGISEDQATTLLLRLVEDGVIAMETEATASIDNTYTVAAQLGDLVME